MNILKKLVIEETATLFTRLPADRTRSSGHELLQGKFCLDVRKKFFPT